MNHPPQITPPISLGSWPIDEEAHFCVVPRAWLGLSAGFAPERVPRICFDCSDRPQAEALAAALKLNPTHTICSACSAIRIADSTTPRAA
jgi:hypothetical protein